MKTPKSIAYLSIHNFQFPIFVWLYEKNTGKEETTGKEERRRPITDSSWQKIILLNDSEALGPDTDFPIFKLKNENKKQYPTESIHPNIVTNSDLCY